MPIFTSFVKYTPEAIKATIATGSDRSIAAKAAVESAGGKFHGMWGIYGRDHHAMMVSEFDDDVTYNSVVMKVLLGGACDDIKTWNNYSMSDVVKSAEIAMGGSIDYKPAGS